jgi:hypothetical protein
MSRIFRPRTLAIMIVLLVLAALTYGFAAANTVNLNGTVGDGSTTGLTGYTVDVSWVLNSSNPSTDPTMCLDFTVGSPTTVYAGALDNTSALLGSGLVSCTSTLTNCSGVDYECPLGGGVSVTAVDGAQVVASE